MNRNLDNEKQAGLDVRVELSDLFPKHGFSDFKWIDPRDIVVSRWVRMKCRFGCPDYGHNASCPPNLPSVPECREFFREYRLAVLFHVVKGVEPPKLEKWKNRIHLSLVKLEGAVFLSGFERAFMLSLDSCGLCETCTGTRASCKNPKIARPTVEAMAVDVYSTVRAAGYQVSVRTDPGQTMDRFALLMVE